MKMLKNNLFILTAIFIILTMINAYSDDYHYINNNVGNRASGLAGAYTAVSDDSSGCYYNPAGIAFAPGNKLSASVNAVQTSSKKYKNVLLGTDGGHKDWTQESFNLLPNFFGIIQKFGPGMFGFSYAVPDSIQRRQKQTFRNIQGGELIKTVSINMNDIDKSYFFGPSYAMKLNDSFSIGATLYYHYRDTQMITNYFFQFESGANHIYNMYSTNNSQGWQPNIGIMWDPLDNLAIGLSISKLWIISTDLDLQKISHDETDPSNLTISSFSSSDTDDKPLVTNLGFAWFYSPSLLFAFDLKYFDSVNDRQSVLNTAFGTEYYLNDFIALRGGLYTDLANTPDLNSGVINTYNEHIDIYGTNFSCTLFSKRTSITLGFSYSFGSGDAQIISGDTTIYDVDYRNLSFQIATSFNY